MVSLFNVLALPNPFTVLLLASLLPTASASKPAETVDTVGFWLGFCLVVGISALEAALSIIWTRSRMTCKGINPGKLTSISCRVCGREIDVDPVDPCTTCFLEDSRVGHVASSCGYTQMRTVSNSGGSEVVLDRFGSFWMAPGLLIRRFNVATALLAPRGLVRNAMDIVRPPSGEKKITRGRAAEHVVHLLFGLADVALGVAALAINPRSVETLYGNLKDPEVPMTFENYLTLFLMAWLLGALLLPVSMPPRGRSAARSTWPLPAWPGALLSVLVMVVVSLVLFGLGCWKIDFARRHKLPWTPMLSYWIGGASAVSFPQASDSNNNPIIDSPTDAAPLPAAILILCTSSTAPGHVLPLTALAWHLVSRGHPVTFVGGTQHRALIEASGSAFFPVHESLTLERGPYRRWAAERARHAEGLPRMVRDFETFFVGQVRGQFASTRAALEAVRRRCGKGSYEGRELLVVNETMWFGYLPFKYGAPRPEGWAEGEPMPRSLGINVTPLMLDGEGMPVFPLGLLPGEGQAARERDRLMKEWYYRYVVKEAYDMFREEIKACGGTEVPDEWMVNLSVTAHDATLQLCDPVLEYPRPDLPAHVKFAGSLPPRKGGPPGYLFPEWWQAEVVDNAKIADGEAGKRRVVVVSQGTLARDYTMLLAPTIRALAGRKDVLVVALLGKQGVEVPPEILPPEDEGVNTDNVRIADFIPYDSVLAYADVMVFNAGYGGFTHCVVNGVPVVAAGLTEDKCEVAARVEWTGVGINLRTGRPTPSAVAAAVDEILGSGKYRARARELAEQVAKGNPLEVVEREVRALTGMDCTN